MIEVMRRIIIRTLFAALVVLGCQRAWSFAFLGPLAFGPDATWQTVSLGYNQAYLNNAYPGSANFLGDVGGPKNIGEEYRRNDTVIFYAYDATFSGYFGLQGETNADQAFAVMNSFFGAHTNGVDGYSASLGEFPFNSQHFNGTAQGLYLTDLKSVILHLLVEQMGLAAPERFTWTLHDRVTVSPPGCPRGTSYLVVQRNFGDVDQPFTGPQTGTIYSPYVNNLLYSYGIAEDCGHSPPPWTAITQPFATDTTKPAFTAVAANNYEGIEWLSGFDGRGLGGLQIGGFYTGLTEDDAAGMRYLMSSNNVQYEIPTTGSQLEVTNFNLQPLTTQPLGPLLQFARTNPPAALLALYPNLFIDSVSNYYTLQTNPIVGSYFTNYPGEQFGTLPTFVIFTNGYTYSWLTNYVYTFGNLVIFNYYSNTPAQLQTTSLAYQSGAQYPTPPITNTTVQNILLTNQPSGQYILIPTNSCGFDIVITNALNVPDGTFTNEIIATATNTAILGNGFVGSQIILEYLTNSFLQYYECDFATSGPAYYQGIQHVQFVRVSDSNVDPLTRLFHVPVTNTYSMMMETNGSRFKQVFRRLAFQPDILLSAFDDAQPVTFNGTVIRTAPGFETGQALPGLSGPGTIDGQSQFSFNKVGTAWWNGPFPDTNSFLTGPQSAVNSVTGIPSLLWASFDGSTNPPIVYPTGTSIQELFNQMVISIQPTSLPNATNNDPYLVQFSAQGGTPNTQNSPGGYLWSGTNFPLGLVFNGGVLYGTPNDTNGVYDVTIQVTDYSNPPKTVTMPLTLTLYSNTNN
ncbi:MAG TPA: hypothetical protein VGY56_09460 [Verrucomicrobiae bacterium]|nr:hypothetical protein [Verrucomicrobiae bacterium]